MRARLRSTPLATRATLAILAAATLSACESAESMTGGVDADDLPTLTRVEELRVGSLDDPELGFSYIYAVDVDADGNVYVLERQEREVRVYARDGRHLRTIGRQGSGPGEFESPNAIGVLGDTVWVGDSRLRRLTLFTRAGDVITTIDGNGVSIPAQSGFTITLRPARLRPDRLLESAWSLSVISAREPSDERLVVPTVLFDLSGAVVDTVGFDTLPPLMPSTPADRIQVAGVSLTKPSPPTDAPLTLRTPEGRIVVERFAAATGDESVFSVTRLAEAGDTIFHRAFRYTPQPYGDELIDSLVWQRARLYEERLGDDIDQLRDALRSAWEMPPFQLPVTTARLGADESVWLRREDTGGDYTWLVLAPDGSPRGQVTLPRRDVIRRYTLDELWAASPDEYDVQWLVRYAITDTTTEPER